MKQFITDVEFRVFFKTNEKDLKSRNILAVLTERQKHLLEAEESTINNIKNEILLNLDPKQNVKYLT